VATDNFAVAAPYMESTARQHIPRYETAATVKRQLKPHFTVVYCRVCGTGSSASVSKNLTT
jgi:hypothetical protein